jgi:hypothetical protein
VKAESNYNFGVSSVCIHERKSDGCDICEKKREQRTSLAGLQEPKGKRTANVSCRATRAKRKEISKRFLQGYKSQKERDQQKISVTSYIYIGISNRRSMLRLLVMANVVPSS